MNLGELTLRGIGELINEKSAQKIKHHLSQLEKRGLIRIDREQRVIEKLQPRSISGLLKSAHLLAIPIVGSANAGPATLFADENIQGYLRISSTFLEGNVKRRLFALKVVGPSMNRAVIDDKRIEDGDFVIIDPALRSPKNGDIVLSVIDGMANIKRFHKDTRNQQIVLTSDSRYDFPPIHIHSSDEFMINGKVIQIVKKPKN
jgi:SOS-response transcriptional repressor LexA